MAPGWTSAARSGGRSTRRREPDLLAIPATRQGRVAVRVSVSGVGEPRAEDGRVGGAGAAAQASAGAAGDVLRAGAVAVPRPELRVRTGDGQAGRRPVPPAARGGPAGGGAGPGRLGRCRAGPAVAAAEHLLFVAGPRQARRRPGADAVRAGGRADGRGRGTGRVLLRAAGGLSGRDHD